MPEPKRPLKVFLCHAHADREAVRALYTRLVKDGVDAWLDKEKLLGGADWEYEIRKAVRESDVVIVCHSQQFNQRGFRQKEVKIALEEADLLPKGEIFIIPVRLEECDVLDDLKRWHWVDLFDEDGYERLMRTLRVRANRIGATLQAKRSWLPKITSPRSNPEPPIVEKEPVAPIKIKPEAVKNEDEVGLQNTDKSLRENEDDAEKVAQEKVEKEIQRRLEKSIKKTKRDLWWEKFKIDINYRLELIRIYRVPILILLVTLAIIIPLSLDLANKIPESSQALNKTPISTVTLTAQLIIPSHTSKPNLKPTETLLPSKTPVASVTPTATTLPVEITDVKGVSMILVPAGSFLMGYNKGTVAEDPQDTRFVDAFYIDKYETTNNQYKECVTYGACALPNKGTSNSHDDYYENSKFNNYPVINVDWYMASAYCSWRDARLPTELEWEKAARGDDGRLFPWGDQVNYQYANYYNYKNDTTEVGSYEIGKSVYGVYDMSGNVREWVSSLFLEYPYKTNDGRENPNANGPRVFRGGAWSSASVAELRTSYRSGASPSASFLSLGFRCARSAP